MRISSRPNAWDIQCRVYNLSASSRVAKDMSVPPMMRPAGPRLAVLPSSLGLGPLSLMRGEIGIRV